MVNDEMEGGQMLKAKMVSAEEKKALRGKGVAVKDILDMGMVIMIRLEDIGVTKEDAEEAGLTQEWFKSAWAYMTDSMIKKAGASLDNVAVAALADFGEREKERLKPARLGDIIVECIGMNEMLDDDTLEEFKKEYGKGDFIYVAPRMVEYGGVILADLGQIEEFAREKEQDLYIIPCSKHEILIVPEKEKPADLHAEDLIKTIGMVNQTSVSERDFLSNNLYHYTRGTHRLEIVMPAAGG